MFFLGQLNLKVVFFLNQLYSFSNLLSTKVVSSMRFKVNEIEMLVKKYLMSNETIVWLVEL